MGCNASTEFQSNQALNPGSPKKHKPSVRQSKTAEHAQLKREDTLTDEDVNRLARRNNPTEDSRLIRRSSATLLLKDGNLHQLLSYERNRRTSADSASHDPSVALWNVQDDYFLDFIDMQKTFEIDLKSMYKELQSHKQMSENVISFPPSKLLKKNSTRIIKPFLSSTFRDFFQEREALTNSCFPFIQHKCNEKGLYFAPIDLRWGVTSDQSGSGQVIKICLDEIDRCRPWFVCFLGFRNGWSLINSTDENPDALLETTFEIGAQFYPWINEYRERSVTELEILHGALLAGEAGVDEYRCLFYFRSADTLESLSSDSECRQMVDFNEAAQKLMDLKKRIVETGHRVRWFRSVDELSSLVQQDLCGMIDNDFPDAGSDPLREELMAHESFRVLWSRVYVNHNNIEETLEEYMMDGHSPLTLYGEPGIGKSASISNLESKMRANEHTLSEPVTDMEGVSVDSKCIIARYIGITPVSSNLVSCLRSILYELKYIFPQFHLEVPSLESEVLDELGRWFGEVLNIFKGKLIIALDGVDNWHQEDELLFLNAIPSTLHPRLRIILTCGTNTRVHRVSTAKNFETFQLMLLAPDDVRMLTEKYLGEYGKHFDQKQTDLVAETKNTSSPLFLVTFLEEMKSFGKYEELNQYMSDYLQAKTIEELFIKVFDRIADHFEEHGPALVKYILGVIYFSRQGMLQSEIVTCLEYLLRVSVGARTFPTVEFSAVLQQLGFCIKPVSGIYQIVHRYARQAIKIKYFSNDEKSHSNILRSFCKLFKSTDSNYNNRRLVEYPSALYELVEKFHDKNAQKSLKRFMLSNDTIPYLNASDHVMDFDRYWRLLEEREDASPVLEYKKFTMGLQNSFMAIDEEQLASFFEHIGLFLIDTGRFTEADWFLKNALQMSTKDRVKHELYTFELAKIYERQGRFDNALKYYKRCIKRLNEIDEEKADSGDDNHINLSMLVRKSSLAGVQKQLQLWDEALATYEEVIAEKEKHLGSSNPLLAIDYNNVATVYLSQYNISKADRKKQAGAEKQVTKAKEFAIRAKNIFSLQFGKDSLQVYSSMALLGSIEEAQEKYDDAITYYQKALDGKINLVGKDHVEIATILNNLGAVNQKCGNADKSEQYYSDSLKLFRKHYGDRSMQLLSPYANIAKLYQDMNNSCKALECYLEMQNIIEFVAGPKDPRLLQPLLHIAQIYSEVFEDFTHAHEIFTRLQSIVSSNSGFLDVAGESAIYRGLAETYLLQGNYKESLKALDNEIALKTEAYGFAHLSCAHVIHDKVNILLKMKSLATAWLTVQEELGVLKGLDINAPGVTQQLKVAYGLSGVVMYESHRYMDSILYYEKQLALMDEPTPEEPMEPSQIQEYIDTIETLGLLNLGVANGERCKFYLEGFVSICQTVLNRSEDDLKDTFEILHDLEKVELISL